MANTLIASTRSYIVIGLGVTGLSVARYLSAKGHPFLMVDDRADPPMLSQFRREFPQQPIQLGRFDFESWRGAAEIVLSPGVARDVPAVKQAIESGIPVVGDIELFAREVRAPVVAITGSNGKTTVTSLVGQMAREAGVRVKTGGNLGTPALDLLDEQTELYVLELSSFQLESTASLKAAVACVLNVSEDHMDRYADLHDYLRAKQRIYFGVSRIVVNRDDPLTMPPLARHVECRSFGRGEPDLKDFGVRMDGGVPWLARGRDTLLPLHELRIHGHHNVANALAALAIGTLAGLPEQSMLQALKEFSGLRHRCQFVAEIRGVRIFNDSKATNVGAALAAINGLATEPGRIVLIAGGDGKGAEFSPLAPTLNRQLKALVAIGRDGSKIASLCDGMPVVFCKTLEEALNTAMTLIVAGDTVLLSPACASFDMFRNYEDRGDQFIKLVEHLQHG